MLDEFLIGHIWAGPALLAILCCSDYALTIRCARLLRAGADKHFLFPIYELNPFFQKNVAQLRRVSPRFLFTLAVISSYLVASWILISLCSPPPWGVYRALLGDFVLTQIAVHLRHVNSLTMFWYARDSRGYRGQISVATWLSYRLCAIQFVTFAAIYLFLFALNLNWFFAGGAIAMLILALKLWRLSKKYYAKEVAAVQADEPVPEI